jgi:membrane protein implicated in regulation of membrane protease activity
MDDWVYWLIAAVILGAGEVMTMGFFMAPFAIGCLVAALVSASGAGTAVSIAVALVISVVILATLRPLAKAHMRQPPALRTGTARLIGQQALVLERITQDSGGTVKIEGETWSARSFVDGQVFEPGDRVSVVEIRGAQALVTE